jgi:predicted  nucleic acid-binding Zn-ribbon protein
MPKNDNVATEAKRLVLMKFAQMKLEQANKLDAQLDQMRLRTVQQMEKLKAATDAKNIAQFDAAMHKNEDIDAFIRLDKGGSSEVNADHMEDLGRTSISIVIERIGRFEVQKPKMIHNPVNDWQEIINSFERYALLD